MAEAGAAFFPECITKQSSHRQASEIGPLDQREPVTTTQNALPYPSGIRGTSDKVVFNDGTAAGVLNNIRGCTRTMHLHEADVTLKSLGLMLPSPADITPTRVDGFRPTLMTLHEKPDNFLRVLKHEKIHVSDSKLNIFVGI